MTKLPRETTVAAQQPAAVVSETVVELLKDMRYGSDKPARRRKSKLNVEPGKSISADDHGQSTTCAVGSRKKREHERKKLSVPVKQLPTRKKKSADHDTDVEPGSADEDEHHHSSSEDERDSDANITETPALPPDETTTAHDAGTASGKLSGGDYVIVRFAKK